VNSALAGAWGRGQVIAFSSIVRGQAQLNQDVTFSILPLWALFWDSVFFSSSIISMFQNFNSK
jgi:hypothetical protein